MRWLPLQVVALCLVLPAQQAVPLAAQTVAGTVVEAGTHRPLEGAFVVLRDDAGERQAAVLADGEGRFLIRAPAAGRYTLAAQLIGYADSPAEVLVLGPGEVVRRTVEVAVQAVILDGIRADVSQRCRGRPDRELRTAGLWEEARKALEIAAWSEAEGALRFDLVDRRRELDAATLQVTGMSEVGRRGYYDGSPYRSVPGAQLEEGGYVQRAADGEWSHFAPDAEVLLSDAFLDTHCFDVRTGDDPDLIGLGFEPVSGRELADIEGVLWLDRGTAELRRLDYTYVNLPYPHDRWPQVGGMVEFERLATGVWIVRSWHIRMPRTVERTGGYGGGPTRLELRSLYEEGAEVSRVRTRAGEVLSEAAGATLYGTVEDSVTRLPLAGATVEVVATDQVTTTGSDGAYRLVGLPAGTFGVRVSHPDLELLGHVPPARDVRLEAGRATRLGMRPALSRMAREACGGMAAFDDPVILHGLVLAPAGDAPAPDAVVRIFVPGGEHRVSADTAGRYVTCIERSDSVQVAATGLAGQFRDPGTMDRTDVRITPGSIVRADLALSAEDVDPIMVTADAGGRLAAVGFHDRARRGTGVFIERAEIESRKPARITDLLYGRSGMRVVRIEGGEYDVRMSGPARLRGDCQPTIWLDGSLARDGGQTPVEMEEMDRAIVMQLQLSEIVTPNEVEAIEVYTGAAGVPGQFARNATCGVVVIWTRRGG